MSERPRLRANLRYVRQEQDGKVCYIVKDPLSLRYFRFGQVEAWLMQHLDGSRTSAEVADALRAEVGLTVKAASVDAFVRRLRELGLAERNPRERSAMVMEQIRHQRRVRLETNHNTLLRMRFSWGDPDALFGRMTAALPFFWTPAFVWLSAALFVTYALLLVAWWRPFTEGLALLYDPSSYTLSFIFTIYLLGVIVFIIHELGHGLTCKRFGGEVHEMGAMLLYFSPAFFCNVNDAWTFERRSHRLWTTFAGGWIQLWIAALAALVWVLTEPGTLLHRLAFLTTLIGGGMSVLINYNPLIPLDGYYALVDWLDLPNLRARAFAYLGAALKRYVLRMDVTLPPATPRERRILLSYGSLAVLYFVLIMTVIFTWVGGLLIGWFGGWGWALLALLLLRLVRKARGPVLSVARVWAAEKLPHGRRRPVLLGAGALLLLVLFGAWIPWTVRVSAPAAVEPTEQAWLRVPETARLEAVHPREGVSLDAGDTVLVLRAPELELAWREAAGAVQRLEVERSQALARGDAAAAQSLATAHAAAQEQYRTLTQRRDALVLRAPFAGALVTPHLEEAVGSEFTPADTIGAFWGSAAQRVRLALAQRDAGGIAPGTRVRLRFPAHPRWTWHTQVAHVQPAETEGVLVALAPIDGDDDAPQLFPGMTGRARLSVARTSIGGALGRTLLRTVRLELLP